jgi:simple sugar transport system permease protein
VGKLNRNRILLRIAGYQSLPILGVLVVLMIVFMFASPDVFLHPNIYLTFLQNIPANIILALGLTLVITAGEIDLSFGSVVAFSGFILCYCIKVLHMPWLGFFAAIAAGGLVGYINGILIARAGVPSIMATLASQFFWFGATVLLSQGNGIYIGEVKGTLLHNLIVGRIGDRLDGIPAQALWALGLAVLLWFILNRHRFGEAILFIGDNKDVARVMGINVEKTKIRLFTLNGAIAGFAAVVYTLEMIQFYTIQGAGSIMPVIAAVFIGGTSIAGGVGSIFGTFYGMFIIASIEPSVVATGVSSYYGKMVMGIVMACALILNVLIEKARDRQTKIKDIVKRRFTPKFLQGKDT